MASQDFGAAETGVNTIATGLSLTGVGAPFAALMKGLLELSKSLAHYNISATPEQARAVLAVTRLIPEYVLYGVRDKAIDPSALAVTVNYLRARSGEKPAFGVDLSSVDLLRVCSDSQLGPILCTSDSSDPLTTIAYWQNLLAFVQPSALSWQHGPLINASTPPAPSPTSTAAQAAVVLAALRQAASDGSLAWAISPSAQGIYSTDLDSFTRTVARLPTRVAGARMIAGESGLDPQLATAVGGNVTVYQPSTLPDGVVLKGSGDAIYVARGGILRHVPTPSTLVALGKASSVEVVPDFVLASLPKSGEPILPPDGTAIKGSADAIYVVRDGELHWVPDVAILKAIGKASSVETVSDATLDALPKGTSLGSDGLPLPEVQWWPVGIVTAASVAVLGLIWKAKGGDRLNAMKVLTDPNDIKFNRIVCVGVAEGDLSFDEYRLGSLLPYMKAFSDAKRKYAISPTDLAVSGRYFASVEPYPIRIEVHRGVARLVDGRKIYVAARSAGARAILVDVIKIAPDGSVQDSRRVVVNII